MLPEKKKIRKEVNVLFIAPDKVEEYWSLVDFMLREGLKYDGDPMNIKDLKEGLLEGAFQLFMMFGSDDGDKYKVFGVFVTRISVLPNFKQCEVILLKGEKRELWQDEAAQAIENLAIQEDCKRIAVHARPGWQKFLKERDWEVKRYLYTKELN
jgi:hypothetical protein|tara:strand:+ start:865 stop:1326 length:462 start_codon:yes stop_codon:yes gene_type:complete